MLLKQIPSCSKQLCIKYRKTALKYSLVLTNLFNIPNQNISARIERFRVTFYVSSFFMSRRTIYFFARFFWLPFLAVLGQPMSNQRSQCISLSIIYATEYFLRLFFHAEVFYIDWCIAAEALEVFVGNSLHFFKNQLQLQGTAYRNIPDEQLPAFLKSELTIAAFRKKIVIHFFVK